MLRSNQDGICKSNTTPYLAETIAIDRASKRQNPWTKCIWTPKNKEFQGISYLIYFQARPSFILCIVHNIKPFQTQLILKCVLILKMCEAPRIFDFPESEQPFRLFWIEHFPWFCCLLWEDGIIVYLEFYVIIKTWENLYRNHIEHAK